ncbi:23S rRNA (guanine(745)-N(1))-methyltransferase [Thaumasiovibrio subtropicus]|uniref:23S rRNA (guanine(745)-N(1))-methyltransferase n=1 Tax=Thaumasiovibrio subtropicus TaxID=1891207 RepID=UPI000B351517|nr:23S rRNA (guanine(745)-N(1))-methyltransferase [Thaumasiovibrio subtropicus]
MSYSCPLCQQDLILNDRTWRCENNHQFDVAKEGYVNLMPAHHKNSKNPGDNGEMMQARRQFLEAGAYQPLKDALIAQLKQRLDQPKRLLDIGCGEGYYTEGFTQLPCPDLEVFGLDISKVAVRYAAKRYPACHFSVASSHRLPFGDSSLDAIIKIYAPCKPEELLRALTPDGMLITVTPGARHLYQLKALIYDTVNLHDPSAENLSGFELVDRQDLHYVMSINNDMATALLQMTPFAWRAKPSTWEALQSSTSFECEADFCIRFYRPQQ